jgi:uncharacterized protein YbjT (DUF2867 family)
MLKKPKPTIVVAGATGFIGQALPAPLGDAYDLIGLSRHPREPGNGYSEYRQTDLFSLSGTERSMEGAQYAIYLVHSMMPSARLVQGHFSDLDLMCADNFARAASKQNIEHIVYVGGLMPHDSEASLSPHLRSRLEVERALGCTGVPVTTLRAGLVVGPKGSSYQLLARLVQRLPIMLCPSWTQTKMQPIGISDLLEAIRIAILHPSVSSRVFDIACEEEMDYLILMKATAKSLGLNRQFMPVPLLSPKLSRLWVSLTTGAPKALVAPLIESLKHEMVAHPDQRLRLDGFRPKPIQQSLSLAAQHQEKVDQVPRAFQQSKKRSARPLVDSVQRMTLPITYTMEWAAREYFSWIGRASLGVIQVSGDEAQGTTRFRLFGKGPILLEFTAVRERLKDDRCVLEISGGMLSKTQPHARLEFRRTLDSDTMLVAIHDFEPRLPWWLYRITQANAHLLVMHRFRRHLKQFVQQQ